MQGDLWDGYLEETWKVVETWIDMTTWWYGKDGEKEYLVLYCKTMPVTSALIDESIDPF